jgi:hypothetical protein
MRTRGNMEKALLFIIFKKRIELFPRCIAPLSGKALEDVFLYGIYPQVT